MDINSPIPASEIEFLRELAKKQLNYANLPVMAERKRLWTLHNGLQGERPMVVLEENTFLGEIMPPKHCEHPFAAGVERQLNQNIAVHETFDDDKVVPDFFPVYYNIGMLFLGINQKRTAAKKGPGFHIDPVFENLEQGLQMIHPSEFSINSEKTELNEKMAMDILGDILPVVKKNGFNHWAFGPRSYVIRMMGMENMYCSIMTEPDEFHILMEKVADDLVRCLRWQEKQNVLVVNNGNDYMGGGSFCFSDELPQTDFTGKVRSIDTFGHLNSQETLGISPEHFNEFIYPAYEKIAREFGLVYYGCCEPVHAFWDKSLSLLPNLRKISISPWCDEKFMAERLKGTKVIYSRKPSPNYIGVKPEFDEDAFTAYIKKTAAAVKGHCKAEFIFRDIYLLHGNKNKTRRAVDITRKIAETMY